MTDAEVITELREENERQKITLVAYKRTQFWSNSAFIALAMFSFVSIGTAYWRGGRDMRARQCSVCPVPTCPVCAPLSVACRDSAMEMKGVMGGNAVTVSCPHAEQRLEPGDHGWAICRCMTKAR